MSRPFKKDRYDTTKIWPFCINLGSTVLFKKIKYASTLRAKRNSTVQFPHIHPIIPSHIYPTTRPPKLNPRAYILSTTHLSSTAQILPSRNFQGRIASFTCDTEPTRSSKRSPPFCFIFDCPMLLWISGPPKIVMTSQ